MASEKKPVFIGICIALLIGSSSICANELSEETNVSSSSMTLAKGPSELTVSAPVLRMAVSTNAFSVNAMPLSLALVENAFAVDAPSLTLAVGQEKFSLRAPELNINTEINRFAVSAPTLTLKASTNAFALKAPALSLKESTNAFALTAPTLSLQTSTNAFALTAPTLSLQTSTNAFALTAPTLSLQASTNVFALNAPLLSLVAQSPSDDEASSEDNSAGDSGAAYADNQWYPQFPYAASRQGRLCPSLYQCRTKFEVRTAILETQQRVQPQDKTFCEAVEDYIGAFGECASDDLKRSMNYNFGGLFGFTNMLDCPALKNYQKQLEEAFDAGLETYQEEQHIQKTFENNMAVVLSGDNDNACRVLSEALGL